MWRSPRSPLAAGALAFAATAAWAGAAAAGGPGGGGSDVDPAATASASFRDVVTVTATRIEVPLGESGRFVEVLTADEIADHAVHSLPELLQLLPGLDVRRRGVLGVQADLAARGATYEQVLFVVDGVPMTNPQSGHHNMDLPVPVSAIERVEVLYGPGSALHGANAAGAVVQIFTKAAAPSGEPTAEGSVFAGEHSLSGGEASVELGGVGTGSHRLTVERNETRGYEPGTELDQTVGWYHGRAGALTWSAGASSRDFGALGFYSTRFPDQIESTDARLATLAWSDQVGPGTLRVQAGAREHRDVFVLDRNVPSLLTNRHRDQELDLQVAWRRDLAAARLELGATYLDEDLDSTNLGQRGRDRWGGYAALVRDAGRWQWRGAVHADRVEGETEIHPNLAASVRWGPGRARAAVSSAYRVPSFTELYYLDPVSAGNPDLRPEHSWTYELGYDWVADRRRLTFTVFERRGSDLIDFVLAPDDDHFRAVNLRNVDTDGVEIVASRRFGATAAERRTLTASWAWLDASGDQPVGVSSYVFDYLRNRFLVRGEGRAILGLRFGATLSWNDRNDDDSYWKLDARLSRALGSLPLRLYLEASNVTDVSYREQGQVEMPGRWVVLGLEWRGAGG